MFASFGAFSAFGGRFSFARGGPLAMDTPSPSSDQRAKGNSKILVVDDDLSVCGILSAFLTARGFEVTIASNLKEARTAIEPWLPDVLLLDYHLTDGVGTQLLQEMGDKANQCAVVMMTGVATHDVKVAVDAMKLGAVEFITKPFRLEDLETRILRALDALESRRKEAGELKRKRIFSQGILLAVEEERQRLARELHDEIGQGLTTLKIEAELLAEDPMIPPSQRERLSKIAKGLAQVMSTLREIVRGLRPVVLDSLGLEEAINRLVEDCRSAAGPEIKCFLRGLSQRLPSSLEVGAYRIVQEAISNALKHSRAKEVRVSVVRMAHSLSITVEDDGVGFELESVGFEGGLGLLLMRERAEGLGGSLWIDSKAGGGTCLVAELPIPQAG
jgi:signal transduction histidine kinase